MQSQPQQLADDFFRLAHDPVSGKCQLHSRAVGMGLAGALLGELALDGVITIHDGRLVAVALPPPDPALERIISHIQAEPQHTLAIWLAFLCQTSYDAVGERLLVADQVRRKTSWLSKSVTYVPTDWATADWPAVRLTGKLSRGDYLDTFDAFLAGLIVATGLDGWLFRDIENAAEAQRHAHMAVAQCPPLTQTLLRQTQAAVGKSVSSYRF